MQQRCHARRRKGNTATGRKGCAAKGPSTLMRVSSNGAEQRPGCGEPITAEPKGSAAKEPHGESGKVCREGDMHDHKGGARGNRSQKVVWQSGRPGSVRNMCCSAVPRVRHGGARGNDIAHKDARQACRQGLRTTGRGESTTTRPKGSAAKAPREGGAPGECASRAVARVKDEGDYAAIAR